MDLSTSPFPLDWLEDETLHGLCVRHVLLAGRSTALKTVKALVTNQYGRIECHFQGHLDSFIKNTKGLFGNHESIIHEHTVVPNYLTFMTDASANAVITALRGSSVYLNSVMLFRDIRHAYPKQRHLRLCIQCVANDEKMRGFAHWRRAHQLPGVYRCLKHATELHQLSVKLVAHNTVLAIPRSDRSFCDQLIVPVSLQSGDRETAVYSIAQVASAISGLAHSTRFEPVTVSRVYRARLSELGLMKDDRLLHSRANAELLNFAHALDSLPDAPQWLSSSVQRKRLIFHMLSPRSSFPRPLLHAMFIAWLFGSLREFKSMYARQSALPQTGSKATSKSASSPPESSRDAKAQQLALRKAEFQELVLRKGMTPYAAGEYMGMGTCTARVWAARLGLVVNQKNTTIPVGVRNELKLALKAGTGMQEIAENLGISFGSMKLFSRLHSDIKPARQQARQAQSALNLAAARKSWLEALKRSRNGDRATTLLVEKDAKLFRRNDPEGYRAMMALYPKKHHEVRKLPRLNEMDGELAVAIDEAASTLRSEKPARRIRIWDIVHILESRGLLNLDCERLLLPLAQAALKRALKRS
jgi:hypothetical protein